MVLVMTQLKLVIIGNYVYPDLIGFTLLQPVKNQGQVKSLCLTKFHAMKNTLYLTKYHVMWLHG